MGKCWHISLVNDVCNQSGRKYRWLIYSAFHKNLRMQVNSRAVEWGRLILMFSNRQNLRLYLRKVALEETRSLKLLRYLNSDTADLFSQIQAFSLTPKKWHCRGLQKNLIRDWHSSLLYTKNVLSKCNGAPKGLTLNFNPDYPYHYYWLYKMTKRDDSDFWSYAQSLRLSELDLLLKLKPNTSYARMFAEDLMSGLRFTEYENEFPEVFRTGQVNVPPIIPAYFDIHTSKGKREIKSNWHRIQTNSHKTPDLRLSGMVLGVLWRLKTSMQFGDIQHLDGQLRDWKGTDLSTEDYNRAIELDQFYYHAII